MIQTPQSSCGEIPKPKARPQDPPPEPPQRRCRPNRTAPMSSPASGHQWQCRFGENRRAYQFKLTAPESVWTLDTKPPPASARCRGVPTVHAGAIGCRFHGHVQRQGRSDEAVHGQEAAHHRRHHGVSQKPASKEDRSQPGAGRGQRAGWGGRHAGCGGSTGSGGSDGPSLSGVFIAIEDYVERTAPS